MTHTNLPHPTRIQDVQKKWRRNFYILLIVLVGIVTAAAGAGATWLYTQQQTPTINSSGTDGNQTVTQEESTIAAVAEKVNPSVVSVVTERQTRSFYGNVAQEGAGTGIIISDNGYVMTNNHVIEGASTVSIIDNEGKIYEDVNVIGRDPLNDIAFLKIDAETTFVAAEIGDSSTVRIGQQVVAIGNALGQYKNTVTSGILSGTGRPVTASSGNGRSESLVDLLQTDASINSGNSGGPLLNLSGQVIGINTAIASNANGIGFAIPINATKGIMKGVIENGTIERTFLGINYLSITPEIAREYDLTVTSGAYIFNQDGPAVGADTPAEAAGLEDGDVIQKINDATIGEQGGLSSILGEYQPGDVVSLTVLRGGETLTLEVTLGRYT